MVDVVLDLALRNPASAPRWFLVPLAIRAEPAALGDGGVHTSETLELGGQGKAIIGRFVGNAGFGAILLPGGGRVRLRDWPVALWDETGMEQADTEIVTASDLTLGGEPAASWLGVEPSCDDGADLTLEGAVTLAARHNPGLETSPVELAGEERTPVRIDLT
jgi:hypothetical protein